MRDQKIRGLLTANDPKCSKKIGHKELLLLTEYVDEAEELAEEVSVGPEVVVLQVRVEVVQQQLLLLSLLRLPATFYLK